MGDKVERSLLPHIQTIEALIAGVLSGFELSALHTFVDAADAGDLLPDARLTGLTPPAWLPDDMGQLHTHLGQSLSRSEIAEARISAPTASPPCCGCSRPPAGRSVRTHPQR